MKTLLLTIALALITISQIQGQGNQKNNAIKQQVAAISYSCPDHPNEISNTPGKCSKCGKTLVKETAKNYKGQVVVLTKTVYRCPKHPTEVKEEAGSCSQCGMALVQVPVKNYKGQVTGTENVYVCPDHVNVASAVPGTCPVCKKPLTEKRMPLSEEKNPKNYKGHTKN
ncbi:MULTISPECIES: heavy metal-binding domain-containing protein [Adhaeribacter]|uniref:Heavy metal binding domain-containing protein n=2 Tax=Adhaeribacter TaxID=299566 RepID=A0A512B5T4_9BACT|nr:MULTISPECIES: heavy metal-binding domain-containing protein [Adhaeribacter]KAA5542043.1 hypothetical protein F0145_19845 [Adhaeribacter rhizoryzae]GEO07301.1 hypothetical protein AAE02nite_49650 [Adhaeribacter aerolatus]